jgi:hypothetical protein
MYGLLVRNNKKNWTLFRPERTHRGTKNGLFKTKKAAKFMGKNRGDYKHYKVVKIS